VESVRVPRRLAAAAVAIATVAALAGCLDEPGIEERWTRLDLEQASVSPAAPLAAGTQPVTVRASITYRRIVTGFAVFELRASGRVSPASVTLGADAPRLAMARDIDSLLANSVSVGRATRAVTGWDHLIQTLELRFDAAVPAVLDSSGAGGGGLFLVCYLGSGDEMERPDGTDTLVVTPFPSEPHRLLPVGLELAVAPPGAR
jgi:hypothetical protein